MRLARHATTVAVGLVLAAASAAQVLDSGPDGAVGLRLGGGDVSAQDDPEFRVTVPNLISRADGLSDPFLGSTATAYRPQTINIDSLTVRDVLTAAGVEIDQDLIVQAVRAVKETPYWKCTAFVCGPGSDLNTNFDTGWEYADISMLDWSVCCLAFNRPEGSVCLTERSLLFSPPHTTYALRVVASRRNPSGRPGAPFIVSYVVEVEHATRDRIAALIEYFSTVAAGATEKPKISRDCADGLYAALSLTDDLSALIQFETVVALCAVDFSTIRDARNASGEYDARFVTGYLVDSDEEPIGCLLIEMANEALWR
jgi:hypothetical protein